MATGGRSLADINAEYKRNNPLAEESSFPSSGPPRARPSFGSSASSFGRHPRFSNDASEGSSQFSRRLSTPPPSHSRRSLGSFVSSFFSRADKSSDQSNDHGVFTTPPEPAWRLIKGARRSVTTMADLESLRFGSSPPGTSSRPPPPPLQLQSTEPSSAGGSYWRSWIPESVRRSFSRRSSAEERVSSGPLQSGPSLSRAASRYTPAGSLMASSIPPVRPASTAPPARPRPISTFASSSYTSQQSGYSPRRVPIGPPRNADDSVYVQSQPQSASGLDLWGSIKSGVSGAYSYLTGGGASSIGGPVSPSGFGPSGARSAPPQRTSFDSNADVEAGGGARLPPINSSYGTQGVSHYSRPPPGGWSDRYQPNASVYSRPLSAPALQSSFGSTRDPGPWAAVPHHYHQVFTPGSHHGYTPQSTQPHYHYLSQPSPQSQHYHYSTQVTGPSRWGGLKTGAFSHINSDDITGGQITHWKTGGGVESNVYTRNGSGITHTVNRWGPAGVTQSSITYG